MERITKIFILFALVLYFSINNYAKPLPQRVQLNIEDIHLISTSSNDSILYTEIKWDGIENESDSQKYYKPTIYQKIELPSNAINLAIENVEVNLAHLISLPAPLRKLNPKKSAFENKNNFTSTEDIKGQQVSKQQATKCVEVFNEYSLNNGQHFATIRISPIIIVDDYNIQPITDISYSLTYEELEDNSLSKLKGISSETDVNEYILGRNMSNECKDMYIIVTSNKFKSDCTKFATWKAQKGFNVILVTIEDILESGSFSIGTANGIVDSAEALRKYLQSIYNPAITQYCFLIGSPSDIPIRYLYNSDSRDDKKGQLLTDNFIPTDIYFSDLKRDWNLKLDTVGVYTDKISTNYSPCMYVGRILCDTEKELNNYFQKLIIYESWPGLGDTEYLGNKIRVL